MWVQNDKSSFDAIEKALNDFGYNDNFVDILKKWGVSVILSDKIDVQEGYRDDFN